MNKKQKSARKADPASAGTARPKTPAEVFEGHPKPVRELAQQLRELAFETLPELTENAYGGAKVRLTLFSLGDPSNVVCGVQPADDGCLFYFHHVKPEDSPTLKIEGTGKHARHVKLRILDRATIEEIRRLLRLARRRAG